MMDRSSTHHGPEQQEDEARGHGHLGEVSHQRGRAQTNEGRHRLVEEVHLAHQDVGRLGARRDLPHELQISLLDIKSWVMRMVRQDNLCEKQECLCGVHSYVCNIAETTDLVPYKIIIAYSELFPLNSTQNT